MRQTIIGVMGPGQGANLFEIEQAYQLGQLIAVNGWILLTGGRNAGVMAAVNKGAKEKNGLTIGILPDNNPETAAESVDIVIPTDLGQGRNNVNVLSSDVIVACGMGLGTASEVALGLKAGKTVILLTDNSLNIQFFHQFAPETLKVATTVRETIQLIQDQFNMI
ncbi:MAG: cytochrome [Microcystaceae cyanobacterium]